MSERPTPETALECAFALLKCSPIGNRENSSEYGRAAYILSEHCQGEEDVSEAAMRIFAERIAELERERDEAREKYDNLATEHMLAINKLCNERDEAREMAQQLIHIASHCLGWHENTNPETITDAINRWNASTK